MATLQDFYPWVSISCPNVPYSVMDAAIVKGAREFCKRVDVLTDSRTFSTAVGDDEYVLATPTNTEVRRVEFIKRGVADFLTPELLDALDTIPTDQGLPSKYAVVETNPLSVRLRSVPSTIETLTVKTILIPTQTASTLDDKLLQWHQEAITAYAKFWLMVQPAQPWSNPELAQFSHNQFVSRCGDTVIQLNQLRSGSSVSVQMRPLA